MSAALTALAGCASSGNFADKALDLVGLQTRPASPDAASIGAGNLPKPIRKVALRIHAGDLLNIDESGRSLSLVVRIYRLRDPGPLLQAPYPTLADASVRKTPPVDGVIDVHELVLTPGQRVDRVEALAGDVTHLAVVALFRDPDARRWRFVFEADGAARSGITLGAHGCALSVSEGKPIDAPLEIRQLAGAHCR